MNQYIKSYLKPLLKRFENEIEAFSWDRWTHPLDNVIMLYGWIHREEPKGRDFVALLIEPGNDSFHEINATFITSSRKYSKKIAELLYETVSEDNHQECKPYTELLEEL